LKGDEQMLYKHEGQVYDYSPLQIEQGFAKGEPLTEKEIEEFNKPKEPTQEEVQAQIKARLRELDALSVRPMRVILHELLQHEEVIEVLEKTDNEDTMKLSEYENEVVYLREQLNASEKQ
jgi:hypothetical protein